MVDPVRVSAAPYSPPPEPRLPPEVAAQRTLDANRGPGGIDVAGVRRDVDQLRAQDPAQGAAVAAAIEGRLTPVQRGEFARPANDVAPAAASAPTPPAGGPDPVQLGLDLTQMGLDLVGIVEPTPFADGSNAIISVGRSIASAFGGNWSDAGGHLANGAISVAGILPGLGDLAKAGKIGKWAQTVADAVSAVAHNPALRQTFEPALRGIADSVAKIPQGAIDAMPAAARESLERMRGQLDEFFAPAARQGDEAAGAGARADVPAGAISDTSNAGRTISIDGRTVTIGAPPPAVTRADGRAAVRDANGDEVALRQPRTFASRTENPDGSVTYAKNGQSVQYDAQGFPVFQSNRADLYLPPDKIVVGSRDTHFREANQMLGRSSDDQLRAAGFGDADIAKLRAGDNPDGFTWHHHQDVGRMQLVRSSEHDLFSGGHTGGWALWGDAGRFTVR